MDYMRGIGLDEMRPTYHALSGLLRFVGLLTQGVALGWFIAPLGACGGRGDLSDT